MSTKKLTDEEIEQEIEKINALSHIEMARLYRFAPAGHIYFNSDLPLFVFFMQRFEEFGGMTPEMSKFIGWK